MSNVQHSNKSNQWYTPLEHLSSCREVLGTIDLDPASDRFGNESVKAKTFITEEQNALEVDWSNKPVTIFMNPPSGKIGNKSVPKLFWQKLMDLRTAGNLKHAIVVAYSIEQLATTQSCSHGMCNFSICIPKKRIRFVNKEGGKNSPTHSSAFVYVDGLENDICTFENVFETLGEVMHPANAAYFT